MMGGGAVPQILQPENAQSLFGGSMMSPIPDPYPVYARLRKERSVVPMSG